MPGVEPIARARAAWARGREETWSAAPMRAHELLLTEALRIEAVDRPLAALMLADAALAASIATETARAIETAERATKLGRGLGGTTEATVMAIGASVLLTANRGRATRSVVRSALASLPASSDALDVLLQSSVALFWIDDYAGAVRILGQIIDRGRQVRWPRLGSALDTLAAVEFRIGRWSGADAHSAEALRLARNDGRPFEIASSATTLARIAAARGAEADSRALLEEARPLAGVGTLAGAYAASAGGFLELTLGHPEAAIRKLEPLARRAVVLGTAVVPWLPDLVEAYARCGRRAEAAEALVRLERLARTSRSAMSRAAAARCRGFIAPTGALDANFAEALRIEARTAAPFERARTELCYGERLRRSRRRAEAALHLRSAAAAFDLLGAVPWADRARRELAPLTRADRTPDPRAETLTRHEVRVASLVRDGATNREAASALFVTPKTVEYHLANIYRKLGVRSRTELVVWMLRSGGRSVWSGDVPPRPR